jgi:hypothetical protein
MHVNILGVPPLGSCDGGVLEVWLGGLLIMEAREKNILRQ